MPQRIQLTEVALGQVAAPDAEGRFVLQLITPGWGSSGHYSAQVLEAAATAGVFKAGMKTFLDHPSYTDLQDRPERSVRDIAGMLTEDAHWDKTRGALVAEAQVFGPYREVLAEMKDAIGVSIRASAHVESGEAEGRQGVIVTELVEGVSADYVTDAGRGGKILQVLESALSTAEAGFTPAASLTLLREARNVGQWFEARMHLDFTRHADEMFGDGRLSREERIAMSGAVGDALDAFTTALQASAPQLYTRDLWEDPQVIAAAIEAALKLPVVPTVDPEKESLEDHMAPKIEVDEAEHARVTAAAARVSALEVSEAAAIARATEAEQRLALSDARDTARPIATTLVGESAALHPGRKTRVVEACVAAVTIGEDGKFDEAAFKVAVEAAVKDAETDVAETLVANGYDGNVTGFGRTDSTKGEVTEADVDKAVASAFGHQIKEA